MDGGEHARQVRRWNCSCHSVPPNHGCLCHTCSGRTHSTFIVISLSGLRFATLSVEDGDKGGGGGGGGGEGGETSKRQKRGGKGMVKVKKKEADKAEKKIQGLIDAAAKLGI